MSQEPEEARPSRDGLAALIELAGGGEIPRPRRARWWLSAWATGRPQDLPQALDALATASPQAREAAGQWLFAPELADELPLRRALLAHIDALLALAAAWPEPWLLEGLAELIAARCGAALRRLLAEARDHDWARRVVALLPPHTRMPHGQTPPLWRARRSLGPARVARLRRLVHAERWDELAQENRQALTLAQALAGDAPRAPRAASLAWPVGPQALEVLEHTARLIAAEGQAAYRVARHLSRALGRVVILMGNACLGGPPLWAAPGPWQQEAGAALAHGPLPAPPRAQAAALAGLRARRLGGTKLLAALWRARAACLLAGRGNRAWRDLTDQASPWLSPEQRQGLCVGSLGLSLAGPPWQHSLAQARSALEQCAALAAQVQAALGLVHGLAARGTAPLVLPWIDKFAASTAKGGDHLYLARLAALLSRLDPPPLLLLIDETVHPGFPSLTLVLAEAAQAEPGLVIKGVGTFAGEAEPADLAAAALQAARGAHVLALRPAPGPHPEACLARAARGLDPHLPLTPASRDGAAWLLAGTALADLGDPEAPTCPQEPPHWLLTPQGFAPLGSWLRCRVGALAGWDPPRGSRWSRYQRACGLV